MSQNVVPVRSYVMIFAALMVLTALTVLVSKVELGAFNFVVAISIALLKATLVVMYFMHVNHSTTLTKLFVASGFVWVLVLFVFVLSDYLSRPLDPQAKWW